MITVNEIQCDKRNPEVGYIHYSIAKREGLKVGSAFDVENLGKFTVVEYVDFRPDINRCFSGFSVREIK